jgi:hypothetical protein
MLGHGRDRQKNWMEELIQAEQLDENGKVVPHSSTKRKRRSQKAKSKGKMDGSLGSGDDGSDYSDDDGDETVLSDSEHDIQITNKEVCALLGDSTSLMSNVCCSLLVVCHQRLFWIMPLQGTPTTLIRQIQPEKRPKGIGSSHPRQVNRMMTGILMHPHLVNYPKCTAFHITLNGFETKGKKTNPIHLFYEVSSIDANGQKGEPGDKHYKCCHGRQRVITITEEIL